MAKNIKRILFVTFVMLSLLSNAQVKVHSNGNVSFGTLSSSWFSGVQFIAGDCSHFNSLAKQDWNWVTLATPSVALGKCWIVTYPGRKYDHRFFVTGLGYVYHRGHYRVADSRNQASDGRVDHAGDILDEITGIWYVPEDEEESGNGKGGGRHAGISAQEVMEVLPEAVTADENGLLYLDYDALTVLLIEAVKEQRQEIGVLRKALEENGLLEPEKP